jgi:hypothetical protein
MGMEGSGDERDICLKIQQSQEQTSKRQCSLQICWVGDIILTISETSRKITSSHLE